MARQPGVALAFAFLAACAEDTEAPGALDRPVAAAVLPTGTLFSEPIGYVASGNGGIITPLALKQGRFLTDDPTASFLRAAWLPTGATRVLSDIAVWAPAEDRVLLFASDRAHRVILRLPHIEGRDDLGAPAELPVTVTEPLFVDTDGSGDAPTLGDIKLKQGTTTTETWTVTRDEGGWWVRGSRSGLQPDPATSGIPFVGENRVISFTITGDASTSDAFTFQTDNHLVEFSPGGTPLQLEMRPDQGALAVIVHDAELDRPVLRWMNPESGEITHTTALAEDACPERMAWLGETLYVADRCKSAIWKVTSPESGDAILLPWPVLDVAPLETEAGAWLYLAPLSGREAWVYDLRANALVDINPLHEGVDGMSFLGAVRGLEAIPLRYRYPQLDNGGVARSGASVAVALTSGELVFMEEQTGCLVQDESGPRTEAGSYGALDYAISFSSTDAPWLVGNGTNDRHVIVNPCAGVAPAESWTLRYRTALQAWVVEGSLSGPQQTLAYEDQRYTSDKGEISLTIRAGNLPSREGWTISFDVLSGVLRADGDNDRSGSVDSTEPHVDLPGDPTFFSYTVGPLDGGWTTIDRRPFVLVPDEGSNMAARVEPQTGAFEVIWD